MTIKLKTKLIIVVGPTASGKTSLSIELCKKLDGEVVSADSMQIYKSMEIATAKPTLEEMCGVKHHLIDFLDPAQKYSVGQYVLDAQKAIDEIISKNKIPVLCGGTGLYVDSLLNDIDFVENSSDLKLREELNSIANEKGVDYLLSVLAEFDPDSAKRLSEERNTKRVIRAIEFYKTTGTTITEQNKAGENKKPKYDTIIFGLTAKDRQYIYDRVNLRVDLMIKNGLLEEARNVLNSELSETSSKAIGYKQLKPYFEGEASLDECVERLKTETRHYAKRQLTWFRRNESINWINIDEYKTTKDQLEYALDLIQQQRFLDG